MQASSATNVPNEVVHRSIRRNGNNHQLTEIDKRIIRKLLNYKNKPSAVQLSRELDIPIATLMRRKNKLEQSYMTITYGPKLKNFGYAKLSLLVKISPGFTAINIAYGLLGLPFISKVTRVFGGTKDSLLAEAVVSKMGDFHEVAKLMDSIKSIEGIEDVTWFIDIDEIGKNEEAIHNLI